MKNLEKNFKNIPNSQAFQDIPRYSKCFCHLHQPQIGKRSQLLRPRPPPRHIASAALVHGWFLIRLSVMWLVETMLKLWNWCKNVRCSLSLSMFARSEHVLNQSILMDPFGFLRQRFFWSTSFTQVHERKERQCFYWRHPVKKGSLLEQQNWHVYQLWSNLRKSVRQLGFNDFRWKLHHLSNVMESIRFYDKLLS